MCIRLISTLVIYDPSYDFSNDVSQYARIISVICVTAESYVCA